MTENRTVKNAFPVRGRCPKSVPDFGYVIRMSVGCIHYKSNGRRLPAILDKMSGNSNGLQSFGTITKDMIREGLPFLTTCQIMPLNGAPSAIGTDNNRHTHIEYRLIFLIIKHFYHESQIFLFAPAA
jgi:hypothetical protein